MEEKVKDYLYQSGENKNNKTVRQYELGNKTNTTK